MMTTPTGTSGTVGYPTTSYSSAQLPQFISQYGNNAANILAGQMNAYNNIPQYDQPLTAGLTDQQTSLINNSQNAAPEAPYFQRASSMASSYRPNFNAGQLQQYMDPYTNSAVGALTQISNRNLMNNILPGINSTFTGAGQFGSTRNGVFTNRALYDNNLANNQTAAQMLNNQFNNAMGQYYQWNQNPLNGASTLGNLGTNAANTYWNGVANKFNLASKPQQTAQTGMTNNYQNWLTQLQLPGQLMGQNANTFNAATSRFSPYYTSGSYTGQTGNPTSSLVLGGLNALGSGIFGSDWNTNTGSNP